MRFFLAYPLVAQSQEIFAFEWTEGEGQLVGSTTNLDPPPTRVQKLPYLV